MIFKKIGGIILVFPHVIPRSGKNFALRKKQTVPTISLPGDEITNQHRATSAQGHAVAGKSGGDKLALAGLADVGKAIGSLENLAGPSMLEPGFGKDFFQSFLQPFIARLHIFILAGLMVFASQDG